MPKTKAKPEAQLTRRKEAQQERSRQKVELILSVTRDLLSEGPAHKVTTIGIAERAGISIGSLYRFFPNKESIFYELFRRWLEDTLHVLDEVQAGLTDEHSAEHCVDAFLQALTEPKLNSIQNWKLRLAMGTSPELVALEEQHLRDVMIRIQTLQRRFGAPPPSELELELMLLQNEVTLRCLYSLSAMQHSPNRDKLYDLCRKLLLLIYDYPSWDALGPPSIPPAEA